MKGWIGVILICCITAQGVRAQVNLVPNPSFEDTSGCPFNSDQLNFSLGWSSYANSPDYFNSCSDSGGVSVPYNFGGFQNAAGGNAYAGIATYMSPVLVYPNFREFVGRSLSVPLTVSQKYYVSFSVCLSTSSNGPSNCATNNVGAFFSTNSYNTSNPLPLANSAFVFSNGIISDSVNWTRIFGSFTADSAYEFIILGNFFEDSLTDTLITNSDSVCASYYFIDDICVSTDSIFCSEYVYTNITPAVPLYELIRFSPVPASDKLKIEGCLNNCSYTITSATGQIVSSGTLISSIEVLDVSFLDNGIYFFTIAESITYKLLINH